MNPALLQIILVGLQNLAPALALLQKLMEEGRTDPTPEEMASVQTAYTAALTAAKTDATSSDGPATLASS